MRTPDVIATLGWALLNVWHDDEEPTPDDLRSADRMWHIAVTRDPRCDANIDDLRDRKVIFEDGRPAGTVLPCVVLRPGDAR